MKISIIENESGLALASYEIDLSNLSKGIYFVKIKYNIKSNRR